MTSLTLKEAKEAIQRGDYMQCLSLLETLTNQYPLTSKEGTEIRMLMITALMGRGEEQKAIAICRLLSKVKDPEIRQQARQLMSILEAPTLPRPASWSIQIPDIDLQPKMGVSYLAANKKKSNKSIIDHPPTGETKAFKIGFSIFVIAILLTLTILLSR